LQVIQRDSLIAHLQESLDKKDKVVAQLKDEALKLQLLHQQVASAALEESKTNLLTAEHKIRFLELEVFRLADEAKLQSSYEMECAALRAELLEKRNEFNAALRQNTILLANSQRDWSDFRQHLEEEFKRRLAECQTEAQAAAHVALNEEALRAMQRIAHLQALLAQQDDSMGSATARCKRLESANAKLRLDHDLAMQSVELHQGDLQRLRRQLADCQARCRQLEEEAARHKADREGIGDLRAQCEALQLELRKTQERLRRLQRAGDRSGGQVASSLGQSGDAPMGPRAEEDPRAVLAMWHARYADWAPDASPAGDRPTPPPRDAAVVSTAIHRPPRHPSAEEDRRESDRSLSVLHRGAGHRPLRKLQEALGVVSSSQAEVPSGRTT